MSLLTIIHYSKKFKWIIEIWYSLWTARELIVFLVVIFKKQLQHDSTWLQDGDPFLVGLGTWALQSPAELLCGHGWRGLSSLRLDFLLSWRNETHPASSSLFHHLLPMKHVSSPWPRSPQSLCLSAKRKCLKNQN